MSFDEVSLKKVRQLVDHRESYLLPMYIVVYTDAPYARMLEEKLRTMNCDGIPGLWYAEAPRRAVQEGLYATDGTFTGIGLKQLEQGNPADFPALFANHDGIEDKAVLANWWRLANGDLRALKALKSLAKKKGEVGEQATIHRDRVIAAFTNEKQALLNQGDSFAAYLRLQVLYEAMRLLPELRELADEVKNRLEVMDNLAVIQDELKARAAYLGIYELERKQMIKGLEQARAAYKELAATLPNTMYAAKAKAGSARLGG